MSEIEMNAEASGSDWEGVARTASDSFATVVGEGTSELLRELLVFGLDESAYAISVERVREIVRMKELTLLPRSPDWMLGVVALRGEIVEVVDLRLLLGLPHRTPNRSSRIIVLHGEVDRITGILVDSVSEVFRVTEESVQASQGLDAGSIREVCRRGEEFISIVDPDIALGFTNV